MLARTRSLKMLTTGLFGLAAAIYCSYGIAVGAFSAGPPASRTGAPALGTFPAETTCSACHASFALNSGPGTVTISALPATYSPGQEVPVTVTISQTDRLRYGFQTTVVDDQGRRAGDLVVTDAPRTQLRDGAGNYLGRQYIEHTLTGVAPNGIDKNTFTFTWRAPAQTAGRVTFYVAGNAANGNGANSQDYIYNINASIQPAVTLATVSTVSAASMTPNASLSSETIASVFGANLASGQLSATSLPLPTTLGTTKVKVRDNAGVERDAGLFFVSATQINYLIPAGTANGTATVTVIRDDTPIGAGNVIIEAVSPSLFAANMNGQGLAAAVVFRIKANGTQSYEPVAQFNAAQNKFIATPIDLGVDTDQVFLILYGTSFRAATNLANVNAQIGGTASEVLFAGLVPNFVGLDQANIRLPRSLAGRGDVNVVFTANNKTANTVTVNIK